MSESWLSQWQSDLTLADCEQCDANFLLPPTLHGQTAVACPLCGHEPLTRLDAVADAPIYTQPPELVQPFAVDNGRLTTSLQQFFKSTWFAPDDMQPDKLTQRLQKMYWPMWLVDADVVAQWQAEVGFDYKAYSHQERLKDNKWQSFRTEETRVRWEPRVGSLKRRYDNQKAPALEEQADIERLLGGYELSRAQPFAPTKLADAVVRLPNRSPQDAWTEAKASLQYSAADECRHATAANHIRQFRWSANYAGQNWTQLLLPMLVTHYHDDAGQRRLIYIHGQSGKLAGQQRASRQKARRWSLGIGALALVLLVITAVVGLLALTSQPDLLGLASLLLLALLVLGVTAVLPLLLVWYFNNYAYLQAGKELLTSLVHARQTYLQS